MWKLSIKWFVAVVILSTLESCGAQWHLKRAIAKDPNLAADTIVRIDTAIVSEQRAIVDTLIIRDTITQEIERNGVIVKIKRIHDTIQINAVCLPDTIRLITEIPIDRVIYKKENERTIWDRLELIFVLILASSIMIMIGRVFKRS